MLPMSTASNPIAVYHQQGTFLVFPNYAAIFLEFASDYWI